MRHQQRNITVPRGGTARLHCTINNVEEDGVSCRIERLSIKYLTHSMRVFFNFFMSERIRLFA